jgi:formate dehydrogenase iron-sulfur subunit
MRDREALGRRLTAARDTAARTPAPATGTRRQGMLLDMTRCIGCQACTVACKEWNVLPDTIGEARLEGPSFQSLQGFTPDDWTLIRFQEVEWPDAPGGMLLRMRKDACHHCGEPPCREVCPVGAITQTAEGAVLINQDACIGCGYCNSGCPFGIPQLDATRQKSFKCTMCVDRTAKGLEPACSKACPTDAIVYGALDELHTEADRRVAAYNARRPAGTPEAYVYDAPKLGGLGVFYILNAPVESYLGGTLPKDPRMPLLMAGWKHVLKPGALLGVAGAVALALTHFFAVGPKPGPSAAKVPTPDEPEFATAHAGHGEEEPHV